MEIISNYKCSSKKMDRPAQLEKKKKKFSRPRTGSKHFLIQFGLMAGVDTICRWSYKTHNRTFENKTKKNSEFLILTSRLFLSLMVDGMKEFFKKSCFILGRGRLQKQPTEKFFKRCSQKFHKIHRKTPAPESLFK